MLTTHAVRLKLRELASRFRTRILVSFCNVSDPDSPVLATLYPSFGPLKTRVELHRVSHRGKTFRGITGMAFLNGFLYVAHQGRNEGPDTHGILALDAANGFRVADETVLYCDPHSMCVKEGSLFVVASSEDSVYRITPVIEKGREWIVERVWRMPDSNGTDEHHINSIALMDGELYVSGFGKKSGELWSSAKNGFIYNIERGEYLKQGINHPHSLFVFGKSWSVCSSAENALVREDSEQRIGWSSYLRGFARQRNTVYLGSSRSRNQSRSTGVEVERRPKGICGVARVGKDGREEILADFTETVSEIYDLLMLPNP